MAKRTINVVDYGAGNLLSVARALEHSGAEVKLLTKPEQLKKDEKIILPGVGAFPVAMSKLISSGFSDFLLEEANLGREILGICLGKQLLLAKSNEIENTEGLNLILGSVDKIPNFDLNEKKIKVPHIGWSSLDISSHTQINLLDDVSSSDTFYFVHSYKATNIDCKQLNAETSFHGIQIPAVISNNNVIGTQFHPEKSGKSGLKVLSNFVNY
jgi:glutamine amidotransferase